MCQNSASSRSLSLSIIDRQAKMMKWCQVVCKTLPHSSPVLPVWAYAPCTDSAGPNGQRRRKTKKKSSDKQRWSWDVIKMINRLSGQGTHPSSVDGKYLPQRTSIDILIYSQWNAAVVSYAYGVKAWIKAFLYIWTDLHVKIDVKYECMPLSKLLSVSTVNNWRIIPALHLFHRDYIIFHSVSSFAALMHLLSGTG